MSNNMSNKLSIFTVAVVVSLLTACASPARIDQMTVQGTPAQRIAQSSFTKNVAVKDVSGGKETNPMWVSNVGNSEFEQALEGSLANAGMLSGGKQLGKYLLVAHMEKVDQPLMGFNLTVTATVNYVLTERATGKEVMNKRIALPFTAGMGDAFSAVERLRLANEGAVRTNITMLIEELSKRGAVDVSMN